MEILFNIVVIVVALVVLYGVWGGMHLIAIKRLGLRKLGCKGPSTDEYGNAVCCATGEKCDRPDKESASQTTCKSM